MITVMEFSKSKKKEKKGEKYGGKFEIQKRAQTMIISQSFYVLGKRLTIRIHLI